LISFKVPICRKVFIASSHEFNFFCPFLICPFSHERFHETDCNASQNQLVVVLLDLQLVVDFFDNAAKMFSTPKPVFPMRE
jgi:hypothetical protein